MILFAIGVALVSVLVLVGPPGVGRDPPPSSSAVPAPDDDVLERAELVIWCRTVLGAGATAEPLDGRWWCAGRPGGVWRMEQLDVSAACAAIGRPDRRQRVTDEAVDCDDE